MENKFNLIDYVDSRGKNPYKKWFDGLKDHKAEKSKGNVQGEILRAVGPQNDNKTSSRHTER